MSPRRYPPRGPRRNGWPVRDRGAQARFRAAVVARADGQCQYVEDGARCPRVDELQAHHMQPGNDDPETGVLLCRPHHKLLDGNAR